MSLCTYNFYSPAMHEQAVTVVLAAGEVEEVGQLVHVHGEVLDKSRFAEHALHDGAAGATL